MKNRILIVEDEPGIAESLNFILGSEGFDSSWVDTLSEARNMIQNQDIDLIVLDIGLPDGTGIDFCKELRRTSNVPVLFLTARQDEIDKIIALEVGGDDYVTKPFSGREVSARIKAILRRSQYSKSSTEFDSHQGNIHINDESSQVIAHNQVIDFSRNEFYLFKLLFNHPKQVFSRAQIMNAVWEVPESSMERTVDSHIKSIRKKLSPINCIQTQRGFGYKFEYLETE